MKIFPLLVAGSLTVNAALVGLMLFSSVDAAAGARLAATTAATPAKKSVAAEAGGPDTGVWPDLHSTDLAKERDRLRAAGFTPELVRAILAAQISETLAARRKAIEEAQGEAPFWKNPVRDPKMQAALRDLYREQDKVLKDLLGRDGRSDDPSYTAYLRRQFGNLPDDKVEQLRQISDDYSQKRSDIYLAAGNGLGMLPEDRQKVAALDKAMHADFATVLTPQELEEYDLRSSNTAQQLRYNLMAFDATEQEYRAIYKLQEAFDDKYRLAGISSPEESRARMDAQKQLTADIKEVLGPQRAADYERTTDYNFRQTSQLVARLELPAENATALWNTQKEFEKRRADIFAGASGGGSETRGQVQAQLTALQGEAVIKVTPLLGGDASRVDIYKQNGGQWLQNLAPVIRNAPPPPRN